MKTFISSIALLGLAITLLAIPSNNQVIAQTTNSEEFIARGTEPFWSVTVGKRGIVYSSPDVKSQTFPYVKPLTAEGRPADLLRVYRLRGRSNNMLMIKRVDNCGDGMSDIKYSYSATLILGNRVLEGCAENK
jgi:uncharacterized membrane protein